jgi:predicted DNA-binding transcriptional regulator YafY
LSLVEEFRKRRRPASGEDLARAVGVSIRTLYRDIASLRTMGADVAGEPGVGFVLRSGFLLPPVMFTAEEVDALVLGSRLVVDRADKQMAEAARRAMAKLSAVMPNDLSDRIDAQHMFVWSAADAVRETIDMTVLRRAIQVERKLRVTYKDTKGAASDRVVWPFLLGYFDGRRILAAWCENRNDIRHFRTDRMTSITETTTRYPRRRQDLIKDWRAREPENVK